jgi:tRNA-Thr(GGU) m(6)t(6)A37 methyltransferase TsaA
MEFTIRALAAVQSPRQDLRDDNWAGVEAVIELLPEISEESLEGIDAFSHLEILFVFDRVDETAVERTARHPRNNPAWPRVGIFAQRGKNRPNRLGTTMVRLLRRDGRRLHVAGLDAVDGTPVVDIKPVMADFLPREPVTEPSWAHELMREYWTNTARM